MHVEFIRGYHPSVQEITDAKKIYTGTQKFSIPSPLVSLMAGPKVVALFPTSISMTEPVTEILPARWAQ